MLVTRLIQHCQDETYAMEYMDYHDSKLLFSLLPNKKNGEELYSVDVDSKNERFDEYFAKYPIQHKRVLNGELNIYDIDISEKDDKLIAMEIARENQERCRKLLHRILKDNLEKWWD